MPSFNAADVVGRTLIARTGVSLKRDPSDTGAVIYTVPSGGTVGVVDTYLLPKAGRSFLYWGFKDSSGRPYYAEHKEGLFDVKSLSEQGALTTAQTTAAAAAANQTTSDKIFTVVKYAGIGVASYLVLKPFLQNAANKLI
jgi:hypothetical protein